MKLDIQTKSCYFLLVYIGVRKAEKCVISSHFVWNSALLSKFCFLRYLFHSPSKSCLRICFCG